MKDPDRRDVLAQMVGNLTDELPAGAKAEIIKILKTAARSRGHPRSRRDVLIVEAVRRLVELGGLTVTRNEATRDRKSACAVVAETLARLGVRLKERSIEDIMRVRD